MESLLAHLARKEHGRLRISRIDVTTSPEWVDLLGITQVPTLVLLRRSGTWHLVFAPRRPTVG